MKAFKLVFTIVSQLILTLGLYESANAQQVIRLYEGKAPGSESWSWTEKISIQKEINSRFVYNVSEPTITAYLPDPLIANGTAILVAPGGGFHFLSIDNEGLDVAKWLNARGITAFVLKYRVVKSETDDPMSELIPFAGKWDAFDKNIEPVLKLGMLDGLAAVKYVRSHAKEFKVDPNRIGFMGFSAGGTTTMSVVYNAREENRPNFVAPVYAYARAIIENEVPKVKTPIFIVAASNDENGFASHSVQIYSKWLEAKQPAELHLYEKGGHGFGMTKKNLPVDTWIERFDDWLMMQGYIKR